MALSNSETIELRPRSPQSYSSDDGTRFTPNTDGSEMVDLFGGNDDSQISGIQTTLQDSGPGPAAFSANLAEWMTPSQRHWLAQRLIEFHRVDLESRKDWDELSNTALELLGAKTVNPDQLPFPGAASMQHPVIAEAVVQFNSNAIEEFFPPTGPVKGEALGDVTDDAEDSAERAANYMNYYLTVVDTGYYADKDQSLFFLPVAGSLFTKGWLDPRDQMPRIRYIKPEDFVAPYFARDLENCPRYCHQYQLTGGEIRKAQALGEFLDLKLARPPMEPDEWGSAGFIEDLSDRLERSLHDEDELFDVLEYHVDLNLAPGVDEYDDGSLALPYIVVVDRSNGEVLAVRRNWKETDPKRKKRIWFAHYKFLPGLGFYGWGFLHVIGSLARAISGSARALLDSAIMATIQGGFRAKDGSKKGGSIAIEPGKWKDVDATIDELNKTFYTPPFKEPSAALHQLFQSMVADARRFASLTEVLVGQADNKAPVGTTLALIEQSMKLFTAVHKRIFAAAREEFRMLRELIHDFAPDSIYPYPQDGQMQSALRQDFEDTNKFEPVADPNIISDVQRIALAQAVLELIDKHPQLYGPEQQVEAHQRFLKALKVPDWKRLTPSLPQPTRMDPVGENMQLMTGKPVRAYPGQRHDLHMMLHNRMDQIAANTLPPDQYQVVHAAIMAHVREHAALQQFEQVQAQMQQASGIPLPPSDIYGANQDQDPKMEMAVSMLAAQHLPPIPPPAPGSQASMQAGGPPEAQANPQQEAQANIAADQARTEADIQNKAAATHAGIQRDTADWQAEHKQRELDHQQKMRHAEEDHRQKLRFADAESATKLLRTHVDATQARRHKDVEHVSALQRTTQTHEQGMRHAKQTHRESLLSTTQRRRAANGMAKKRPMKKAA